MSRYIAIVSSYILLILCARANAVTYKVLNRAIGYSTGDRFEKEVGSHNALKRLSSATELIWQIFNQTDNPSARKPGIDNVTLVISITPVKGKSLTEGNHIFISTFFIKNFLGDFKHEITGLIYHEMTHVWQWKDSKAPTALIEGIADYVKIKAGYLEKCYRFKDGCHCRSACRRTKPGDGESWTWGGEYTAYFLDYCEGLRPGFVAELNARMKTGFNMSCFEELLGKPIDRLWDDYKAKYKHG